MRQAREDELICHLFEATRGWTPALRNGLALESAEQRVQWIKLCGSVLAEKLRNYMIFPAGERAPLNETALANLLVRSITDWRPMLRRDLASRIQEARHQARWSAADILHELLKDCEVLTDNDRETPPFRLPGDLGSGVHPVTDIPAAPGRFKVEPHGSP